MPGPSKRGYQHSGSIQGGENDHPFLTPKGYRLMQNRKRAVNSVPVSFPEFQNFYSTQAPAAQGVPLGTPLNGVPFGQPIPTTQPIIIDGQVIPVEYTTPPFSVEQDYLDQGPLQNLRPSKQFPDPTELSSMPLTLSLIHI